MPGGMAEANKPPRGAAERELREELGLELSVGRMLLLEWTTTARAVARPADVRVRWRNAR